MPFRNETRHPVTINTLNLSAVGIVITGLTCLKNNPDFGFASRHNKLKLIAAMMHDTCLIISGCDPHSALSFLFGLDENLESTQTVQMIIF